MRNDSSENRLIAGLLLVAFGLAMQFFGAWGIDFAFQAALHTGRDFVGVPWIGNFSAGEWWNLNFFVFFPLGAIMMIVGGVWIGRTVRKIR